MKAFLLISGGNLFRQLVTFIGQLYIVKKLGVSSFGELTFAFSIYMVMAGIGDFGTRIYSWKQVLATKTELRSKITSRLWCERTIFVSLFSLLFVLCILIFIRGHLKYLLLLYAICVVMNQATFDWVFLSLEKIVHVFFFNSASGLIYLFLLFSMVQSKNDIFGVPVAFFLSYLIPAVFLFGEDLWSFLKKTSPVKFKELVHSSMRIPLKSHQFMYYELFQRLYLIAVFLVAWHFYSKKIIGEFRISQLLFVLVSTLSVYLGVSFFNKVHEESITQSSGLKVVHGVVAILLIVIPISITGIFLVIPVIKIYFGENFQLKPLQILFWGLLLPVLSNFIRETVVAAGFSRASILSYISSIAVVVFSIFFYHPNSIVFLALTLLLGEGIGLIVLLSLIPFPVFSRIRLNSLWVPGVFGFVLLFFLKKDFFITDFFRIGSLQLWLNISVYLLVYGVYAYFIRKEKIEKWIK